MIESSKTHNIARIASQLNVSVDDVREYLKGRGYQIQEGPNARLTDEQIDILKKHFASSKAEKDAASKVGFHQEEKSKKKADADKNTLVKNSQREPELIKAETQKLSGPKILGKIELDQFEKRKKKEEKSASTIVSSDKSAKIELQEHPVDNLKEPTKKSETEANKESTEPITRSSDSNTIKAQSDNKLKGLTVIGKIDIDPKKMSTKPLPSPSEAKVPEAEENNKLDTGKRKRRRVQIKEEISKEKLQKDLRKAEKATFLEEEYFEKISKKDRREKREKYRKEEISQEEIELSFKKTLADLHSKGNKQATKLEYKEKKKSKVQARLERDQAEQAEEQGILKVTEYITTSELATLMNKTPSEVIAKCLEIGAFVSINQRLDADIIKLVAEEFGFEVQFVTAEEEIEAQIEEEDTPDKLKPRDPIVTIMGHVDHGKTTLLDFIRKSKVAEAEAGGITQHIGAYEVFTNNGRRIVFLDTPGHEAFTAMRARGAKVTDVAIIVVAADDNVMPQTIEAINHAQVAGVPFVIAINKIDKEGANPTKIKEQLATKVNVLVEEWGGKVQSQEISAKKGIGIDELLEKVILEADLLDLKANPDKKAVGTVIESSLDKGRGYVATVLVQSGTLHVGDPILAGYHYGKVKAMYNHRGEKLQKAIPSTPVQILGFNGAPQAGDKFTVMNSEREAREIAMKREQIIREQSIRTTKRVTLAELGRRISLGTYKKLNIILKGDVDGSVEALSDALVKLSTEEIDVNILHKGVGPVTESDVLLAATADAIIIGFQVRPTPSARKTAEQENVEIRLYSIIYSAIDDVKAAMEGMLAPKIEEKIIGNLEVRELFKIRGVGTIAGCMVTEGLVKRNAKVRIVRNGIVIFGGDQGGEIASLKRLKDDVNEVKQGFDCGVLIKNFSDFEKGDIIEVFEQTEVKRTLK
ncbi:MAG: translation initiation factor IF-2 [Cytophagales bacterium]|nr:translation initiation factor IF-2 [Cytophagales bacterium]MDW8383711.1 translation initiation factor IF-2 [Flammeovirgaceae bacterium]